MDIPPLIILLRDQLLWRYFGIQKKVSQPLPIGLREATVTAAVGVGTNGFLF
jgi:hypothetical protein